LSITEPAGRSFRVVILWATREMITTGSAKVKSFVKFFREFREKRVLDAVVPATLG
jgi:hypothetical protein